MNAGSEQVKILKTFMLFSFFDHLLTLEGRVIFLDFSSQECIAFLNSDTKGYLVLGTKSFSYSIGIFSVINLSK